MKRPLDHTETAPGLERPSSTESSEVLTPPLGLEDTVVRTQEAVPSAPRLRASMYGPALLLTISAMITGGLVTWGRSRGEAYAPPIAFRARLISIPTDSGPDFEALGRPAPSRVAPTPPPSPIASPSPRPSSEPRRPSPSPRPSPSASAPPPTPSATPTPTPATPLASGTMNVIVRQSGRVVPATIRIDGKVVGQSPLQQILPGGHHEVEATALGQVLKREVEVPPNGSVRVAIDLAE
ncbi:MAG: hypothetical protein U1E65_11090 [Myxococcota bacterium]